MPKLPDIEPSLVQRARQKDEVAIAQIYEKLNKKAYVSVYYILGADERFKENAKTITQDTFRNAFKKIDFLKDDDKFAPWFYTSLKNRCYDFFDSKEYNNISKRHIHDLYEDNTSEEFRDSFEETIENENMEFNPDAVANKEEIKKGLNECLQKLPVSQKEALILYYFQGLTMDEMSEVMDAKTSTIKSWLKRGKESIENQIIQLRKENKSFYSVLPIPALVWTLQEAAKEAPQMDAKKFASQIIVEAKMPPIKQVKKPVVTNEVKAAKTVSKATMKSGTTKVASTQTAKTATSILTPKLIAAATAVVLAAGGGAYAITSKITSPNNYNEVAQTTEKSKEDLKTKEDSQYEILDDQSWSITGYTNLATVNGDLKDIQLYGSPFEDDPIDAKLQMGQKIGNKSVDWVVISLVCMQPDEETIPDKNGVYWAVIGNGDISENDYYFKLQVGEDAVLYDAGEYNHKSLADSGYDVNAFKNACGADLADDIQIGLDTVKNHSSNEIQNGKYNRITQLCNGEYAYY